MQLRKFGELNRIIGYQIHVVWFILFIKWLETKTNKKNERARGVVFLGHQNPKPQSLTRLP